MKTFEEFIDEATHISNHRRTATQMAILHKNVLKSNGHTILNHETMGDGSHVIHHLTPTNKVRVSTIKDTKSGANNSQISDRPATPEEYNKYSPKK